MLTVKSAQRKRFEEDTFPHLEAVWRSAKWLTMRRSYAEDLVFKTMTRAYHSWSGPGDIVGSKARLFRSLVREFRKGGNRKHTIFRFLDENGRATQGTDDRGQQYRVPSIDREGLSLLARISDRSVKGAIARLRPESRLIMILLFRERFSHAEIAYITDLRVESVKSKLGRLRRLIPQYILHSLQRGHISAAETDNNPMFQLQTGSVDSEHKFSSWGLPDSNSSDHITRAAADSWENEGGALIGRLGG
ncbi:MAG: hypothetical protein OEV49_14835 [candidate division Zixibacteria bacterium]|nr:hypothetical protein [candidate division Zixibacteria bacterium]MDH3938126.1 hypothetical protein [candidate division Zixibacteria bacterium]MDH4032868.1 hypothetical protein [candidate division Zixibacteria bacterium]